MNEGEGEVGRREGGSAVRCVCERGGWREEGGGKEEVQ